MKLNRFTQLIRAKGWTVDAACQRWGIAMETYYKRCKNDRLHQQFEDMCKGLPDRLGES